MRRNFNSKSAGTKSMIRMQLLFSGQKKTLNATVRNFSLLVKDTRTKEENIRSKRLLENNNNDHKNKDKEQQSKNTNKKTSTKI